MIYVSNVDLGPSTTSQAPEERSKFANEDEKNPEEPECIGDEGMGEKMLPRGRVQRE